MLLQLVRNETIYQEVLELTFVQRRKTSSSSAVAWLVMLPPLKLAKKA